MSPPKARIPKGFRDVFSSDLQLQRWMIDTVRDVYEEYGFMPLETPAVEFVDALGKCLPESQTPEGGIFSLPNQDVRAGTGPEDPDYWIALRYDLTAPLARVIAQYPQLPKPFRRYQVGSVWRYEKPGPGRYREFTQFDFDSVGVPGVEADAEACMIMADVLDALGFDRGDYVIKVSDRKLLQGMLEACGLGDSDINEPSSQAATVLRALDKLDRLGWDGVRRLLGKGRRDDAGVTGDFTKGAELAAAQIDRIERFLIAREGTRAQVCQQLEAVVGDSAIGREGIGELRAIDAVLGKVGYDDGVVVFDPTIVRGLSYYTGPVYEGLLTTVIEDEDGKEHECGSVFGGGRYDRLVERFTGEKCPGTGASVGVSRLLEAVRALRPKPAMTTADVLVTVFDKERLPDYFALAGELRQAGLRCEVYQGGRAFRKQLKYADNAEFPIAVIAGPDEFERGVVQVKDLPLGRALAAGLDREEWKAQPAQQEVARAELAESLKALRALQRGRRLDPD